MGRALFSSIYRSTPVVVEHEPEPQPNESPTYATWSHANKFDPDSDDFFSDAEYEAFILPESAPFSDSDHQDQLSEPASTAYASPMAVGDDPANAFTEPPRIFQSRNWTSDPAFPEPWRVGRLATANGDSTSAEAVPSTIPPSPEASQGQEGVYPRLQLPSLINPPVSESGPMDVDSVDTSTEPSIPMSMTRPIPIRRALTPSSGTVTPSPPSTPPLEEYSWGSVTPAQGISVSISPPPSVSPRLYTWTMNSPSPARGPFGNSAARASFSRLGPSATALIA